MKYNEHHNCCHSHESCNHHPSVVLSENEVSFLHALNQTLFLPVVQFIMTSKNAEHFQSIALTPVYMTNKNESMEKVKDIAAILITLEEYSLIELDFNVPLDDSAYDVFRDSELFAYFVKTVDEGKLNPGFLFDSATMEYGRMAITELGQQVASKLAE